MQMLTLLSRERSERGRGAGGEADRKVRWYLNSNKFSLFYQSASHEWSETTFYGFKFPIRVSG